MSQNKFVNFNNFQTARQTCFRSFFKNYKENGDSDESLQKALDTAKINNDILKLTPQYYKGLQGEIVFFAKYYESFNLDPLVEIGDVHADFRSQVTNKYYDVTTNTDYKDLSDYIRNDSKECMITFVDVNSEEVELIPTVFHICPECGEALHYVYCMGTEGSDQILGIDYQSQNLYNYCQQCGHYKEVDSTFYEIYNPNDDLEFLFGSQNETTLEARMYLNRKWTTIANLARKDFDVFISCVTRPESEMGMNKHDLYEVNNPKWIHPILDLDKNQGRKIIFDRSAPILTPI
ncbi:MAG: hypothetical protein Q7J10_05400 [Methanosarcinaceae archaeon]|nr:hypothetical protein [Methanosarcinaceae archaeon]